MSGSSKRYKLPDGRILFVGAGFGQDIFMTYTRQENGAKQHYKSKSLPLRNTLQEAQQDLDQYAKAHKLEPDTLVKVRSFDPEPAA